MNPFITVAIKAVRRGASVILRSMPRVEQFEIQTKGHNDFVTVVDQHAEQEIIEVLSQAWPEHGFLCEESGARDAEREYVWIIDPLDGTTNYIHGYPQFSVSVALRRKKQMIAALVFDPLRDELFTAARGEGAYLNDRRIRASRTINLSDALLVTGFPHREGMGALQHQQCRFGALLPCCRSIRISGSAALDIVHVACGRLDGSWHGGLQPWDIAAAALIVQEAGGLVGDFENGNNFLDSGNIVCSAPAMFEKLLAAITEIPPPAAPDNAG